ncbi:hypothetical protein SAMN05880570_0512 [Paenibacillus sp. RU4T]|uniref:hypothetical protein n=1 Tax=unclassified Paenibacillus TaxID=185978 RepID=UPI0009554D3D|nr:MULTISPECIES: hypothetical protein [unclassified Paenibacillus]SIQ06573.1 hypothetical protein SAMN05880555_0513 [Paenibacillus sp. RU4X]SIQ26688.1 hypothetical protein SAMN05880570_0512 [Paenibacillus sp. RU4T]
MAFNEKLPKWDAPGTEPPDSKKVEGWKPNDHPPADYFNWLQHQTFLVTKELQEKAAEKSVLDTHATANSAHGATSAATASRIMQRDSSGRAKVAAPAAADDIARKDTVDTHANATMGVHGATNAATPSTIPIRDASGRFQVAAPVLAAEVARKDTVDMAVQPLQADLANTALVPLSLAPGQQIVTVPRDTPFNVLSMRGRTLVNLLGRDGNCESIAPFAYGTGAAVPSTVATSSADATIGTLGIRLTWSTSNMGASYFRGRPITSLEAGKRYVALMDVKTDGSGITGRLAVRRAGGAYWSGNIISTGASPSCLYFVAEGGESHIGMFATVNNVAGRVGFDAIRCYEISQTEYNALSSMTPAQIAAKYPYVDDVKNVNGVYVRKPGLNLIPPFSEWNLNASASFTEPYRLTLTTAGNNYTSYVLVDVVPNTDYTLMGDFTGYVGIYTADGSSAIMSYNQVASGVAKTFNTASNTQIRIYYSNAALGAGTYTLSNLMLSLGSSAYAFVPKDEQYVFYPDVNLASNVDGSVYDELYTDSNGHARIKRMFKSMDLSGDMPWLFGESLTGAKRVYSLMPQSAWIGTITKFDGAIIGKLYPAVAADQMYITSANNLHVTISNTDSGWGDNYTPTTDEIKAYFYGWKMGVWDSPGTVYNGTGTKAWTTRRDGWYYNQTSTLPTTPSSNIDPNSTWQNYRLQYQLASQADEPTRSEGAIMLNEGTNTIEVGTGAVVKERANPSGATIYSNRHLNFKDGANVNIPSGNQFKNRAKSIIAIYKNRLLDKLWTAYAGISDGSAYGSARADIFENNIDVSAVYEVTYLALDTYQIGIAPSLVSGQYAPNAREVTDGLVKAAGQLATRVAVLENGTAQAKQPQWITPTLLNGWQPYANLDRYKPQYKKVGNTLQIKGVVWGGAIFNPIFYLPKEMRPVSTYHGPVTAVINGTYVTPSNLCVDPDGRVFISVNAATTTSGDNYNYINAILPLD